jgi:hypothetical protein
VSGRFSFEPFRVNVDASVSWLQPPQLYDSQITLIPQAIEKE